MQALTYNVALAREDGTLSFALSESVGVGTPPPQRFRAGLEFLRKRNVHSTYTCEIESVIPDFYAALCSPSYAAESCNSASLRAYDLWTSNARDGLMGIGGATNLPLLRLNYWVEAAW